MKISTKLVRWEAVCAIGHAFTDQIWDTKGTECLCPVSFSSFGGREVFPRPGVEGPLTEEVPALLESYNQENSVDWLHNVLYYKRGTMSRFEFRSVNGNSLICDYLGQRAPTYEEVWSVTLYDTGGGTGNYRRIFNEI
jgi:hypothetical protein